YFLFFFFFFIFIPLAAKNEIFLLFFPRARRLYVMAFVHPARVGQSPRFRALMITPVCLFFAVLPMLVGTGGGPQTRRISATTVFSGMLVATVVGIVFIPA
ncbi:efflux RND transporter permease subunit, partial [Enterobacter hormaechei]